MPRITLPALCLLALSACSRPPAANSVVTPATISQPCDPLPVFEGKTSDDLVSYNLRLISLYKQCATRHAGIAE